MSQSNDADGAATNRTATLNEVADRLRALEAEADEIPTSEVRNRLNDLRIMVKTATPTAEWEVGVQEAGDSETWDWFHARARDEDAAKMMAKDDAEDAGFRDPYVYEVHGPFPAKTLADGGER